MCYEGREGEAVLANLPLLHKKGRGCVTMCVLVTWRKGQVWQEAGLGGL